MAKLDVFLHPRETLAWPFEGRDPYYLLKGGEHTRHEAVDPFPAYAHDMNLVNEHLQFVAKRAPINMDVTINILSSEGLGRTNGHATHSKYWTDGVAAEAKARGVEHWGVIVFSAKRIPPHPGMTKYLVAHEYGHLVEGWLNRENKGLHETREAYATLRGLSASSEQHYGGGTWHKGAGELFANDFRVLVCSTELSYWPHLDIPRPETLPQIIKFWQDVQKQLLADATVLKLAA